jgi:hypothetical protein
MPEAGLLNKSSNLADALDSTKFIRTIVTNFVVLLMSDLDIQQTSLSLLNKGSRFAVALVRPRSQQ